MVFLILEISFPSFDCQEVAVAPFAVSYHFRVHVVGLAAMAISCFAMVSGI